METKTTVVALNKSSVLSQMSQNLMEHQYFEVSPEVCEMIYKILFSSIPSFLFHYKSKDAGKVALKVNDAANNMLVAGIVSYHESDNEDDDKGNWYLEFTFDEDDLKDIANVKDNASDEFVQIYEKQADRIMRGSFRTTDFAITIFTEAVNTLKFVLQANAKENEIFEISEDGYFIASSTIEGGEVVLSIVPGDAMKTIIKDDSTL